MISNAPDANDADRAKHAIRMEKIGFGPADSQAAIAILTGFKGQYRLLVDSYNQEANEANAKRAHPDLRAFRTKRDQLVQATIANLKSALTSNGWTALDASVRAAKQNMQISATGGVQ